MADLTGGGAGGGGGSGSAGSRRPLGFLKNAAKRKVEFFQLLLMTGVLMTSIRCLGQKNRHRELVYVNADLRREHNDLSLRMRDLQDSLHREAEADESGALAAHLRRIFAAHPAPSTSTGDK
uniref:Uncharacterized protein n=1 Tax=Leersia perrieri TaxID=77586 RepID=A0A0D9WPE4_9ORYZ